MRKTSKKPKCDRLSQLIQDAPEQPVDTPVPMPTKFQIKETCAENRSPRKTYSEKLGHPKWQRKRLEILERDEFKCQYCGSTEDNLHVHHAYYRKGADPWDYDDDDLTTLCAGCHKKIEDDLTQIRRWIGREKGLPSHVLLLLKALNLKGEDKSCGCVSATVRHLINALAWLHQAAVERETEYIRTDLECMKGELYNMLSNLAETLVLVDEQMVDEFKDASVL